VENLGLVLMVPEVCQVTRNGLGPGSSPGLDALRLCELTPIFPLPCSFTLQVTREPLCSAGEEGMSLHIYIAHSGEHLLADPVSFASYVQVPF
jgi:hypothetical protein